MATRKSATGSKTAHVLNVISGDSKPAADIESAQETAQESTQAATSTRRPIPPILEVVKANDDALSEQIRNAIEAEAAPLLPQQPQQPLSEAPIPPFAPVADDAMPFEAAPPAPEPATSPQAAPSASKPDDALEAAPAASTGATDLEAVPPTPEAALETAPAAPVSATDLEKAPPAPDVLPAPASAVPETLSSPISSIAPNHEEMPQYVNVMQTIVEEKATRYIRMFGLCDCPRCVVDVKALALTSLPSKYVVKQYDELVPMLSVYESRFNTTVTAQLIHACKLVMDNPRHGR